MSSKVSLSRVVSCPHACSWQHPTVKFLLLSAAAAAATMLFLSAAGDVWEAEDRRQSRPVAAAAAPARAPAAAAAEGPKRQLHGVAAPQGARNDLARPPPEEKRSWSTSSPRASSSSAPLNKVVLTFSDPREYEGPIVEGWPPNKSRSLPPYVRPGEDNFLLRPKWASSKEGTAKILFVVHSAPKNFEARQGIRSTWALSMSSQNATLAFLLGTSPDSPSVSPLVREEAARHGDLLVADFVDHYNNLTIKSLYTLKFVVSQKWKSRPEYLFKLDDDSYVNVETLWRLLDMNKIKQREFILGKSLGENPRRIQVPSSKKHERYSGKWVCPTYMFNGTNYPRTLSGSGYVMTYGAAECLYREALKLPFFHLEDVFVTGFAAQECPGVAVLDSPNFHNNPTTVAGLKDPRQQVILHYKTPEAMQQLFKVVLFDLLRGQYNEALKEDPLAALNQQGKKVFVNPRESRKGPVTNLLQVLGVVMNQVSEKKSERASRLLLRDVVIPNVKEALDEWPVLSR